jgi:hypothetical protein
MITLSQSGIWVNIKENVQIRRRNLGLFGILYSKVTTIYMYQMDMIVKIMIFDWKDIIGKSACVFEGQQFVFKFIPFTVSKEIVLQINVRISLPIKDQGRTAYSLFSNIWLKE